MCWVPAALAHPAPLDLTHLQGERRRLHCGVAAKLNADGVRPRRGDRWTATGVQRAPVHLGLR